MSNKQFSDNRRVHLAKLVAFASLVTSALPCFSAVPDWFRSAADQPLRSYNDSTKAVVLLEEQSATISGDGTTRMTTRRVIRILQDGAADKYGHCAVNFDSQNQLTYFKAWVVGADHREYELKEKDAIETNASTDILYQDERYKVMRLPAVKAGAVVGYEYQQTRRSTLLQDEWEPQSSEPVRLARYSLHLPSGWQYRQYWMNSVAHDPSILGGEGYFWEIRDLAAIPDEPLSPSARSVAIRLGLTFIPLVTKGNNAIQSWNQVGTWFDGLSQESMGSSAEIDALVRRLAPNTKSAEEKITGLASYVQSEIRYAAIEIGIGGFQPHLASSTLANRYGDCKDKATLLVVLLRQAGFDAYPVLVNSDRGVVRQEFPSPYQFNHMIVAISLPQGSKLTYSPAATKTEELGQLLIFDPTAETWPVGMVEDSLQGSLGMVVAGDRSFLLTLPVAPASASRFSRTGNFTVSKDGGVTGSITETYTGSWAARLRAYLADKTHREKGQFADKVMSGVSGMPIVTRTEIVDEPNISLPLTLRYQVRASGYAKLSGDLMLIRAGMMGSTINAMLDAGGPEGNMRTLPIEYQHTGTYSEAMTVELPAEFAVDEIPDPLTVSNNGVTYKSHAEATSGRVVYERECTISLLTLPPTDFQALKSLYRDIHLDGQKSFVLRLTRPF